MNITLKASPFGGYSTENGVVTIPGQPEFSRIQWLNSDLTETARLVARECRDLDVEPVIRVGGSSQGYLTLKTNSGVTDLGSPIKHFPWDVFGPELKKAYDEPVNVLPAELVGTMTSRPTDSAFGPHIYEEDESDSLVELAAISGDQEALEHVIAVAAGDDHARAARAKAVLAQVPQNALEAWDGAQKA